MLLRGRSTYMSTPAKAAGDGGWTVAPRTAIGDEAGTARRFVGGDRDAPREGQGAGFGRAAGYSRTAGAAADAWRALTSHE